MMIREMTHNECAATIAAQRLARLACAENDCPYVVPISYAYSASRLFAFSMPGKKLDILHANPRACLLVDALETRHKWKSVIVDALFHELPDTEELHDERLKAWALLAKDFDWWEPGALKPQPQPVVTTSPHVFFELQILAMSGREAMSETTELSH
ncbi:nitroimidazol reductase NimA-like FMN-containing flavoprotein (pyridoxamine 5'-phosphate oxidase superfamily) [Shinella sp. BE166]|uniref:pyridoxamine 5'-phosphate oxidase family protein n=1 Tax=Shinella sp. BE166 TaxID=3373918 RepID=UPI003EB73CFD